METEKKGLLERAKDAVADAVSRVTHSEIGEKITEQAHEALHKLEELAPKAVAGPVHAVAEAAASLLPDAPAHIPSASGVPKSIVLEKAAPVVRAAPQERLKMSVVASAKAYSPSQAPGSRVGAQRSAKSSVTPGATMASTFKTKRGQKH